jgi:putative Mg2+ transporter-C (MgtC) family protein
MSMQMFSGYEQEFLIGLVLSFILGFAIGAERESRGKSAGISTHSFVIAGSALFTLLSIHLGGPTEPSRIASQIVVGIGFLGAGMILKADGGIIKNLTTAASIWFSAAIGISIGFQWYFIAIVASLFALLIPRIPHLKDQHPEREKLDDNHPSNYR